MSSYGVSNNNFGGDTAFIYLDPVLTNADAQVDQVTDTAIEAIDDAITPATLRWNAVFDIAMAITLIVIGGLLIPTGVGAGFGIALMSLSLPLIGTAIVKIYKSFQAGGIVKDAAGRRMAKQVQAIHVKNMEHFRQRQAQIAHTAPRAPRPAPRSIELSTVPAREDSED